MGPITATILGLLLLAIVVSLIVYFGKRFNFLDATLAQAILWGTVAVIGVVFLILILRLVGVDLPARLP